MRVCDQNVARPALGLVHVEGGLESVRYLGDDFKANGQRHFFYPALRFTPRLKILAFAVIHHEIERRLVKINILHAHNVGVRTDAFLQNLKQRELPLERAGTVSAEAKFEDAPIFELFVAGNPNLTEAPFAQFLFQYPLSIGNGLAQGRPPAQDWLAV